MKRLSNPHFVNDRRFSRRYRRESGMTLIELMIASLVLAIGLGGLSILFVTAAVAAQRTKLDTNSTLVAKLVMEAITASDPAITSNDTINITDCAGTPHTVNTVGGSATASPPGAGANIVTTPGSLFYGGIDFTQAYATPAGSNYAMQYKDCGGVNGNGGYTTYDVRWNVITYGTDSSGNVTSRLVTVGAHQYGVSSNLLGHLYFAFPVSLRSVGGPTQ